MIRSARISLALCLALPIVSASPQTTEKTAPPTDALRYKISLAKSAQHLVEVSMDVPPGPAKRDLQLPVWNALYQVRDFAEFVQWVRAETPGGQPLHVIKLDKTTWSITGAEKGVRVEYEIVANRAGPFGAQANQEHAFFNLAEILMYPVDSRKNSDVVMLADFPATWRIATPLRQVSTNTFEAGNYDHLVDSPVEIGSFRETTFEDAGARYHVVVDADPTDYDLQKISDILHRIVHAETTWMGDHPLQNYFFIYHFPRGPAGGGMEHAFSTAIDMNASRVRDHPEAVADVTAHEFFHLWNVKRIRPQSLEPIDYTRENYTTALWFSEGFTSTAGEYALLRAGLKDEARFLRDLAGQIAELQRRPAHRTQSAEESSLDTWLEKYDDYRLPERSISYYNKGLLLGVMLDLQLREGSQGRASLRDLFHWMNQHYAQQGRFFPDTQGVREAAEAVSHAGCGAFFAKYVAATDEIPYDQFFQTVGLRLVTTSSIAPDPGFSVVRNYGGPPTVSRLDPGGPAERAGFRVGDTLLKINGQVATTDLDESLSALHPGDTLHITIRSRDGEHDLSWMLTGREQIDYELKDLDTVTPRQRARRTAWLSGEDQSAKDGRP